MKDACSRWVADLPMHSVILALLLAAVIINYIDRGNLAVAAPVMAREFSLSNSQRGLLLSAFFWTYSLCQLAAGWTADRFNVKWVYAGGFLVWSAATVLTGWVEGFGSLLLCRLLLGVGESVTYPAGSCILARNFSQERLGVANGLVDSGSKIGPALSMLIGGLLVGHCGWRALFVGVGLASLLWLVPWILLIPGTQPGHKTFVNAGPGMLVLLRRREVWGTSLGMFALGYAWTFLISWVPSYLTDQRGFSLTGMSVVGSLPFWAMACSSIAGGWLSDRWIARGRSPGLVRKGFIVTGLLGCAVLMFPVDMVESSVWCLALLIASSFSLGIFTSNVWAVTQTLAGPNASGKWAGIQNCIGNLGGVFAPMLTGQIVERTHSYFLAFVTAAGVLVAAIGVYLTLVRRVAPVNWEELSAWRAD